MLTIQDLCRRPRSEEVYLVQSGAEDDSLADCWLTGRWCAERRLRFDSFLQRRMIGREFAEDWKANLH